MFTRLYVKAQVRLATMKNDEGQGTLEYIGMVVLAGVLIIGLLSVFTGAVDPLKAKVQTIIDTITGA